MQHKGPAVPAKAQRVVGQRYLRMDSTSSTTRGQTMEYIWNGRMWHCEHNRRQSTCVDCGGSSVCEHGRQRQMCKEFVPLPSPSPAYYHYCDALCEPRAGAFMPRAMEPLP